MFQAPFVNIIDPTASRLRAVDNGFVFLGKQDTDPTIPSNQIPVYYTDENGNKQQLSQPIQLNASGVPVLSKSSGTIINPIFYADVVSIVIRKKGNKSGDTVYSNKNYPALNDYFTHLFSASGYKYSGQWAPNVQIPSKADRGDNYALWEPKGGKIIVPTSKGDGGFTTGATFEDDFNNGYWFSNKILTQHDRKEEGFIYVSYFLNFSASFSDALQLAVDSAPQIDETTKSYVIVMPHGVHKVTKPLWLYQKDGLKIQGPGRFKCSLEIENLLDLTMPSNFAAINGTFKGYKYDENQALFIVAARRVKQTTGFQEGNGAAWFLDFKGFDVKVKSNAFRKVDMLYAPEIAHSNFEDIYTNGVKLGHSSLDTYRCEMNKIDHQNCIQPIKISGGTSNVFNAVGSSVTVYGYEIKSQYSTMNSCTIDNWADGQDGSIESYAYDLAGGMTLNSCGAEYGDGGLFRVDGGSAASNLVINGGNYIGGSLPEDGSYNGFTSLAEYGVSTKGFCFCNNASIVMNAASVRMAFSPNGTDIAKFQWIVSNSDVSVNNLSTGALNRNAASRRRYLTTTDFIVSDNPAADPSTITPLGVKDKILTRVRRTGEQTVPAGTDAVDIELPIIDYDNFDCYKFNRFIVPLSGYYNLSLTVTPKEGIVNWVGILGGDDSIIVEAPTPTVQTPVTLSPTVYLKKGQSIRGAVRVDANTGCKIASGAFLQVEKL